MTSDERPPTDTGAAERAAPSPHKLKERVVASPPELDESQSRRAFWFVAALLLVTVLAVGVVLALNVVADPYGSVGTHFFPTITASDRTAKADRIEALKQPPQLVVLGSSRSMRYEPSYLQKKTGLRTFNAGVTGIGGTSDAWAMSRFIHEVWPDSRPAYLWLVDVESFVPFKVQGKTASEPRIAKYVGAATASEGPAELARAIWQNRTTEFSLDTARESVRLIVNRDKARTSRNSYQKKILADGVLKPVKRTLKSWNIAYPRSAKRYGDLYRNVYKTLDPAAQAYFEKTLAFMNKQGATPILALTPLDPKLRKIIGPLGWDRRHEQVVEYIDSLHAKYRFVFIDITDPRIFHADPDEFLDGVHMTPVNTRKAIDYILKMTGGVPATKPAGAE